MFVDYVKQVKIDRILNYGRSPSGLRWMRQLIIKKVQRVLADKKVQQVLKLESIMGLDKSESPIGANSGISSAGVGRLKILSGLKLTTQLMGSPSRSNKQ